MTARALKELGLVGLRAMKVLGVFGDVIGFRPVSVLLGLLWRIPCSTGRPL